MGRQRGSRHPARIAWRRAYAELRCCRYQDGSLEWCAAQGDDFWELTPLRRVQLEGQSFVAPLTCPRVNTGLHAIDLRREQRRSGVPRWFMPGSARRKRAHHWVNCSPVRWVHYRGTLLVQSRSGAGARYEIELMVYLAPDERLDLQDVDQLLERGDG